MFDAGKAVRKYQANALKAVGNEWRAGRRATLVVMATGTGKTVLFAEAFRRVNGNCLALTHTKDLAHQTRRSIANWAEEDVGLEMAQFRELTRPAAPAGALDLFGEGAEVVAPRLGVASIPTLASGRLDQFDPLGYQFLVLDECHHAAAPSWRKVVDHFQSARVLGVTATPDRADEKALGAVFESVAFEYHLADAIADGWLVPLKLFQVETEIDLSEVRTNHGDFNQGDLESKLLTDQALLEMAIPIVDRIVEGNRLGVAFTVTVKHAHRLAKIIDHVAGTPGFAGALDGTDDATKREEMTAELARGERKVLANCALFLEGWDCPPVSLVAMGRPTKSRGLYSQMIGRGTRLHGVTVDDPMGAAARRLAIAQGPKPDVEILDFVCNSGRHQLVTAVDIMAGSFSDAVVAKAKAKAEEAGANGESVDPSEILAESLDEFELERARGRYELKRQDPFGAIGIDLGAYRDGMLNEPPTEKQRALLEKKGLEPAAIDLLSKRTAGLVIDRVMKRQDAGLCSAKQAKILSKRGVDPMGVTFDEAGALIDLIAGNQWTLPAGFDLELWRANRRYEIAD